jgi:hypothetical protein
MQPQSQRHANKNEDSDTDDEPIAKKLGLTVHPVPMVVVPLTIKCGDRRASLQNDIMALHTATWNKVTGEAHARCIKCCNEIEALIRDLKAANRETVPVFLRAAAHLIPHDLVTADRAELSIFTNTCLSNGEMLGREMVKPYERLLKRIRE